MEKWWTKCEANKNLELFYTIDWISGEHSVFTSVLLHYSLSCPLWWYLGTLITLLISVKINVWTIKIL